MRKTLLLTVLLLVCAAWVVAQQGSGSQATAGETSVEGCLGGAAGAFTLSDKAGTTYQLQLPASADKTKLSQHIGQEVRVTGTMASATPASPDKTPSAAGSTSGGQTINVSKMDKIADTCGSSPGAEPSKEPSKK
jgi:hypothetical protein